MQLAVRLGVHTGLVVVGDVGGGTRQEQLALGETPNLAARLQGIAVPNTLVISAATFSRSGPPLCLPPLAPAARGLCPPDHGARAAETADPPGPADDPVTHRRAAARALCHGRPALGRSLHAGAAQSPRGSRPHRPHPGAVHLSVGLPPALDGACPPHPGDAAPFAASSGGGDDEPCGPREGPARGDPGAGGSQDGWRAVVCGGTDQDGAGVRPAPGAGGLLRPHRSPAPTGDSGHPARLAGRRWGASLPMPCSRPSPHGTRGPCSRGCTS